jgi:hypothetical protein
MTHAVASSGAASTQPALSRQTVVERAAAQPESASLARQAVPNRAALSKTANLRVLKQAHETNMVALTANDTLRDHAVVSENHVDAPAVAMLHRNESADLASEPSIERTVESATSSLPFPLSREQKDADRGHAVRLPADVVRENRRQSYSPSTLHLQHESIAPALPPHSLDRSRADIADESSPEFNRAAPSHAGNSIPAATSPIYAASSNYANTHSSGTNTSRTSIEPSPLARSSEPTFRPTSTILRSPRSGDLSAHNRGPALSRDTALPLVVQESVVARTSYGEPMRSAISGGILQHLSASAGIAPQAVDLMHRRPSTAAGPTTFRAADPMHLSALPVSRQAASVPTLNKAQIPSLPSMSAGAPIATSSGGGSPDITQLANRVYEVLVRRLASERQRRGR